MKLILLFSVIAALASVVVSDNGIWGQREPGDSQIFSQVINTSAKKRQVLQETVKYNPWLIKPKITAIIVNSLKKGAEPDIQLIEGGVGEKKATLRLTGQRSKGIRADVVIYGKKENKD